jgi:uncharacterized protein YcfL
MKTSATLILTAFLLFSCAKKERGTSESEAAQLIETRMAQFAASNSASLLQSAVTNRTWGSLTADLDDALTQGGKAVVAEVIFPDVKRDDSDTRQQPL